MMEVADEDDGHHPSLRRRLRLRQRKTHGPWAVEGSLAWHVWRVLKLQMVMRHPS
jgi:hypothetical protein